MDSNTFEYTCNVVELGDFPKDVDITGEDLTEAIDRLKLAAKNGEYVEFDFQDTNTPEDVLQDIEEQLENPDALVVVAVTRDDTQSIAAAQLVKAGFVAATRYSNKEGKPLTLWIKNNAPRKVGKTAPKRGKKLGKK